MESTLYSLYLYDADNSELVQVIKDIDALLANPMAMFYHTIDGYLVKVVDQFDGVVTYTLG
jgi:hypothetical protein